MRVLHAPYCYKVTVNLIRMNKVTKWDIMVLSFEQNLKMIHIIVGRGLFEAKR